MLQREFEERIGRKVTEQEYVEANAMYMAAGDGMDKDTFCKEWKKIGNSPLVRCLFETANQSSKEHEERKIIISDAVEAILAISGDTAATVPIREKLEREAYRLVGMKEVIKRKARMLITYNQEEMDYINEHLM